MHFAPKNTPLSSTVGSFATEARHIRRPVHIAGYILPKNNNTVLSAEVPIPQVPIEVHGRHEIRDNIKNT